MSWINQKHISVILTVVGILLLGKLNFLAGYEVNFSIFYLVPIAFALWRIGKRFALASACVGATVWCISDLATGHTFSNPIIPVWNATVSFSFFVIFIFLGDRWKNAYEEKKKLVTELEKALEDIKVLSGLIPICAWCKKVRDDAGYWHQVEAFIQERSEATFTHSICPTCMEKWKKERGLSQ
jgi:hypothetical protein